MKWAIVGALGMSVASGAWGSTVIVDNTSQAQSGTAPVNYANAWTAQAFTSDGEYTLDSISAMVGNGTGDLSGVSARLYTVDAGGNVGSAIDTFSLPELSGSLGTQSFVSQGQVRLHANQTYFFALVSTVDNPDNPGHFDWAYTESVVSLGGGSIPQTATYANSYDQGQTWTLGDGLPQFIAVYGTAVPEPAAGILLLGLGSGLLVRRRRG